MILEVIKDQALAVLINQPLDVFYFFNGTVAELSDDTLVGADKYGAGRNLDGVG